jgi:GABA(A) receptor-associated protein
MIYKNSNSYENRVFESGKIRNKYPDRYPCIVERNLNSDITNIDKKKFLVPGDLSMGQFVYIIRKRIELSPEKAVFVLINDMIPSSSKLISEIYKDFKDDDGFLYIVYSGENSFGLS